VWRDGRYFAPLPPGSATRSTIIHRRSTGPGTTYWTADSPELAMALRSEQRLTGSLSEGGFRALTVRVNGYGSAQVELAARFGARPVNVAARFVSALRSLVDARPKPTWQTVLGADAADPGSRDALKLAEFTRQAWEAVHPELLSIVDGGGPLLLCDAAPLARYRAMELLDAVAGTARGGAGVVWLLCPMEDPGQLPKLDGTVVPIVTENEWIALPDLWVANGHRSGDKAS
jgi:hypothetical protein